MSTNERVYRYWERIASEIGIPIDGLAFVYAALDYTRGILGNKNDVMWSHVTAAQYCDSFVDLARQTFGNEYANYLRYWRLDTSEKLGRVVYDLIDRKLIGRQESDELSDFDGQFDMSGLDVTSSGVKPQPGLLKSLPVPIETAPEVTRWVAIMTIILVVLSWGALLAFAELYEVAPDIPVPILIAAFVMVIAVFNILVQNRFQFRLRTLLLITTLVCLLLGMVMLSVG